MKRFRAPMPYRVCLYDYSSALKCRCNRKALCWTSWSDDNPGRRYCSCPSGLLRREKEEEQQHVQRIQEENGELRQMIVQLEKEDEFNKKMEEKEKIDFKEKSNFSCFSRCIVVFALLGLLFVLKYSSL